MIVLLNFANCVNQTTRSGLNKDGLVQQLLDEMIDWLVDHVKILRDRTFKDDEGDQGSEGGDFEDNYGDSGIIIITIFETTISLAPLIIPTHLTTRTTTTLKA